jgi:hypothetical protein
MIFTLMTGNNKHDKKSQVYIARNFIAHLFSGRIDKFPSKSFRLALRLVKSRKRSYSYFIR